MKKEMKKEMTLKDLFAFVVGDMDVNIYTFDERDSDGYSTRLFSGEFGDMPEGLSFYKVRYFYPIVRYPYDGGTHGTLSICVTCA